MEQNSLNKSWSIFQQEMNALLPNQREYNIWFKPLVPVGLEDHILTIRVPSQDYCFKLEDDYFDIFKVALEKAFGKGINLTYRFPTSQNTASNHSEEQITKQDTFLSHLDTRMTFDNFYVGNCNKLASSVAQSIVNKPGETAFNPFFIFGASGVGKTHLLHAIGNALMASRHEYKAVYVPAQTFKRQFVEAIITNKKPEIFYNYYQNIDLLLIDDIQEFSEAMSTQNAFFQIFNHLKLLGKQIVITSDRCPADLKGMEERLYSRLKWGMTVEIERPDLQLRKTILNVRVKDAGIKLPDDVFNFIVKHTKESVRDIEGALTSLLANAIYCNEDISLSLAEKVLTQTVGIEERKISVADILDTVAKYYDIEKSEILGRKRKREIVQARQVAMYLSKTYTDTSLAAIGTELGNRHHSTVIYAEKAVNDLLDTDAIFRRELDEIKEKLNL